MFIGMCNVYRHFVKDFASLSSPLTRMLRKDEPDTFKLDEKQTLAFKTLKSALASPPVLALPQTDLPYVLDTDAGDIQIGCVLMQQQEDKTLRPLGFFSKTLTETEQAYDASERECLAIVWAVTLLRPYLEASRFTIRIDHDPLR